MKKWILALVTAFIGSYILAVMNALAPPPQRLLCALSDGFCRIAYEQACDASLTFERPTKDCLFEKYKEQTVRFELGTVTATGSSFTVIILDPEQAKNNSEKPVPECKAVEYERLFCSAGYAKGQPIPFPEALPQEGKFVLRFALRDKPTSFTATIRAL